MYIAIDDTDSRQGMCTTYLATELVKEFSEYQLLDFPRLVRLNPNVPWKTRGNGAIVVELGNGDDRNEKIGDLQDPIHVFDGEKDIDGQFFDRVKEIVERWAEFDQEGTNPGFIVSRERPDRELYEKAVKGIVELDEVLDILENIDCNYKGYGKKRGLIGAAAALSWSPDDHSYELIAYREREQWGTKRDIRDDDVKKLDKKIPSSFDNYDYEEEYQVIAPKSPCPVLYGVRGDDLKELQKALNIIKGEKVDRWITFLTNQGTDDHIQEKKISDLEPWISAKVEGKVTKAPEVIEGGHVFIELSDDNSSVTAAAYEPTKNFREIVKKLILGDKIQVWGGVRKDPLTINMEKMKVLDLAKKKVKVSNPTCPNCGKNMSSMGKDAGYRCKRCRTKADEDEAEYQVKERDLQEKIYETPVCARRHLSKPIKRVNTGENG